MRKIRVVVVVVVVVVVYLMLKTSKLKYRATYSPSWAFDLSRVFCQGATPTP